MCRYDFRDHACRDDPLSDLFDDWVPYYRLKWATAAALQPRSILEIGVRFGYSAAAFLDACPSARYLGVDADVAAFGGAAGALDFAAKVLQPYDARIVVADTQQMQRLPGGPYDLIHVDGQQDGDGSFHDLDLAVGQAKFVLVDGYHWNRLNCLAVTEFLHRNLDAFDWYFVLPGYGGDLLAKCAVRHQPSARARSSADLTTEYTSSYYLRNCAGHEQFAQSGGSVVDDPRLQAVGGIAGLFRPRRVLDLGCGRGELAVHFARNDVDVVGVDYSAAAIDLATKAVAKAVPSSDHVTLTCGDIRTVPIDGSFDVAIASDIVEHLAPDELNEMYTRIQRHLAPSGRLVVHTNPNRWFYEHEYPRRRMHARALGAYLPPEPRSREELTMHINEQDPQMLATELRAHFAHVAVWAATLIDPCGTLDASSDSARLDSDPELFAIASDAPLDLERLARDIAMRPLDPTVVAGLHLHIVSAPPEVQIRSAFALRVRIDNESDEVLSSNFPNPVQLGHRWRTASDPGDYAVARTRLFPWAMPHSSVTMPMMIEAPAQPGVYELTVAAVQEFVRWFDSPSDALAATVRIHVAPGPASDISRHADAFSRDS